MACESMGHGSTQDESVIQVMEETAITAHPSIRQRLHNLIDSAKGWREALVALLSPIIVREALTDLNDLDRHVNQDHTSMKHQRDGREGQSKQRNLSHSI